MPRLHLFTIIAMLAGVLALTFGQLRLNDYLPLSLLRTANDEVVALPASVHCEDMELKVLTYDPLVIHFVGLVSPEERVYLINLSQPLLHKSTIIVNGENVEDGSRTSSSAYLPDDDPVVKRIADRVHKLQGYMNVDRIDMQVTAYQEGQHYVPHFDWYQEPGRTTNRFSTFFATLDADCSDCGTQFPELRIDWSARDGIWCQWFDCSKDFLTTKNVPGGALFWRNLDENYEGRLDTLHAGLPAAGGHKIGLNIWTEVVVPSAVSMEEEFDNSTWVETFDVQDV